MGTDKNLKLRCAGALFASMLTLASGPVLAQEAAPSDTEMASAAPTNTGSADAPKGESDGNSKEVYGKHVERVKKIKSLFDKLRQQVESMETQQQPMQTAQLAPDLPPEALQTEDDPAPSPEEAAQSVLDEAPKKAAKDKKPKKGKKDAAAPELAKADEDRENADSAGGSTGTYTVKAGDTLGKIAARTLGSSKKAAVIAKANGMGVAEPLKVGRNLIIPGGSMTGDSAVGDVAVGDKPEKAEKKSKKGKSKKDKDTKIASAKSERKPKNPASEPVLDYSNYDFKMYVVKPGDSLSKIAKAFYESGNGSELIRKYNKLGGSPGKEVALKSGEKILIPLPKQKASEARYENAKKGIF